jgi:crotonobetainyl-CoA:carnitine CoA-transferase CaiB-like acyl-CoA transferase
MGPAIRRRFGLSTDPVALIEERADVVGLRPRPDGQTSRNGTCRLLPTADGWMALSLARPWDLDALAAWAGASWSGDPWQAARRAASAMPASEAVERAQLLGVAAAICPGDWTDEQAMARSQDPPRQPWLVQPSPAGGRPARRQPLVVDLTSLWAGPLAGRLLSEWGADVVKVEDPRRPDGGSTGAGAGAQAFSGRLNAGKRQRRCFLPDALPMMEEADVVITSGRPRVWEHLGVPPLPGTWVRITGYGSTGPWRERVAFGDDAAVAGGLIWPGDPPAFVGDAIADPLTGIMAAAAAVAGLATGGGLMVDLAMREVAAWLGRPGSGDRIADLDVGAGRDETGGPARRAAADPESTVAGTGSTPPAPGGPGG